MVRAYPAAWPVSDGLADELPTVYFHMVGYAWPPANPDAGCPAGWAEVSDWEIECELDAPLLPGQIKSDPKFTAATGKCTVEIPQGVVLAPWRAGSERTPDNGKAELWASYDGPTGSTRMLLGQFVLDPMKGNVQNPYLAVTFVQDTIRLRKDHTIPTTVSSPMIPLRVLEYAATSNGFAFHPIGGLLISSAFIYFPRKTDQLDAMQQIVQANLAAMFLSMDGSTIEIRNHEYLAGSGPVHEVVDVEDQFDKLEWSQDPNAKVDRVEVTYVPPLLDTRPIGPAPFNTAAAYTVPKGMGIPPGATAVFEFDPGSYIAPLAFGPGFGTPLAPGSFQIIANQYSSGTGDAYVLNGTITQRSSGNWLVSIPNPHGIGLHLVLPYDPPPRMVSGSWVAPADRGWDAGKSTPSFIPGTIDRATESESAITIAWGAPSDAATNVLQFNMGRNVQYAVDAQRILDLVVVRATNPTYVIEDVQLPLDFRRELADLYRVRAPSYGFDQRALVTKLKLDGDKNHIHQTASLAILPLVAGD
jgi:hypothetical protein